MPQQLKFKNIFVNSKEEVKKTLTSLWTGVGTAPFQNDAYREQIIDVIENVFAPDNESEKAEPLVQSMYKWEGLPEEEKQPAVDLVSPVWQRAYKPFKHQYNSWNALLNNNKSIVVTTGTGSGKTECFMMPLIKDLADNFVQNHVEALFLYPLNALMEDQKSRLSEYISNSTLDIKFAVYNGNTPERLNDGIDLPQMPHELIYRTEIRNTPPNILLTNPTMLEYMLLRQSDQPILQNSQGSLKWIVIDETHTFTGAGAAELALLVRRVLQAFGVTVDNVRFATSSATIGDDDVNNTKLKQFIADISGKLPADIEVIKGQRVANDSQKVDNAKLPKDFLLNDDRLNEIQSKLITEDFVKLSDLIPEKDTIVEKLEILDALCEAKLPAKVHYFFKVLDCGLNVKLTDITTNNTFNLYTVETIDNNDEPDTPLLELCRCKRCGNFVAFGQIELKSSPSYQFRRRRRENENIFLTEDETEETNSSNSAENGGVITFGIKQENFIGQEGASFQGRVNNNVFTITQGESANLIALEGANCPFCFVPPQGNNPNGGNDPNNENHANDEDDLTIGFQAFRVSSEFISRIIAPRLLDEMIKQDAGLPYNGSQFLSFVDSRQGASRATLNQNLFNETRWVQSRVFHWLTEFEKERNNYINEIQSEIIEKEEAIRIDPHNVRNTRKLVELKEELGSYLGGYKTWKELLDYIISEPDFELLCKQFIKDEDLDGNGVIKDKSKREYAQVVLFEEFNRRPKSALIAETLGFVQTYYPKLETIKVLPPEVIQFNDLVNGGNKVTLSDWKNFLKIYLDYTVRSNGSLYFKRNDWNDIDIFSCQRFQSKKNPRRPAVAPQFNARGSQNRFVYLIAAIAEWDTQARKQNRATIEQVLNAVWHDVTRCGIIVLGQKLNGGNWVNETQNGVDPPYRMNISDMALKVGLTGAICPVTNRPIDVIFKGYSPYIKSATAHKVETTFDWTETPFPYINGKDENNEKVTNEQIETWATATRSELTELGLWTSVSNLICSYPKTFIQAEHTAQVNKDLAKQHQQDFKDHKINILACSTTMEMGVDLGDLELVVMNSIPPHPANYKQRAGRSGRNDFPKSCVLTFCNSDPIGMRTMRDPMGTLITRPTAVPMVDLNSPQVVQRHVNAFLFKSWIGQMAIMNERIIEFFTTYNFAIDGDGRQNTRNVQNFGMQIRANAGIGEEDNTEYRRFIDYLNNIPTNIRINLKAIVKDTCYEETTSLQLANNTISAIERVNNELKIKFRLIQEEWSDNLTPKQITRLNFKFSSILSKNLIMYLSTHQFTPNANMPVNIIEFDTRTVPDDWSRSKNPSYELRQALSQYVPGNTVVLDNSCYIVRGVEFTNQFNRQNTFKQIQKCNSCGKTWIDKHGKCVCPPASIKIWEDINGKNNLELIEPVGFTRDINEDYNRIKNSNVFTYVNAQLIGADNWSDTDHHQRLFEFRSSQEDETSSILFYNLGIGYGFCVCKQCGKAVIEYEANVPNDCMKNLPIDFNNEIGNIGGEERTFHYDIRREKNLQNRHFGKNGNDDCTLKRNMLLGGTIQTDYCEIRMYDDHRNVVWDSELLHTLGITLTNVLAKYIGIERKDISFIVLNDSICIYDTAKGGAGYSKRLNNTQMLYTIFDLTLEELRNCTYKEDLIDRSTKQYVDKINISETISWLELEKASREIMQDIITAIYPNAKTAKFQDIIDNYIPNGGSKFLFINSKFERWNYEEWKLRLLKIRQSAINGTKVKLCFYGEINHVPVPAINLLNAISDWADLHYCHTEDDLYPIAKLNNKFFFTDDESQLQISSQWASDNLYCTDVKGEILNIQEYKIPQPDLGDDLGVVKFTIPEKTEISSKGLYKKLKQANTETEALINNFKQKCINKGLEIRYKDEHLKSKLGIIITLQFINELARDLECKIDKLIIENEVYANDNYGKVNSLTANAPDSDFRDELIQELCETAEIEYNEKGKMPHWRVLEVACNGFQLNIYPNGGFANGWIINKEKGIFYKSIDTTLSTDIYLLSREEIMFDIENINITN